MKLSHKVVAIVFLFTFVVFGSFLYCDGRENDEVIEESTLREIILRGNENISRDRLLEELGLRPGDQATKEELEEQVQALRDLGYFRSLDAEVEEKQGEIYLTLSIEEYPVLEKIQFDGVNLLPPRRLRKALEDAGLTTGEVINENYLNEGLQKIAEEYEKDGYPFISTGSIQIENVLQIEIVEGRLTSSRIEGLETVPEERALELIKTPTGEPVKIQDLQASYQALERSIYFSSVDLVPTRGYDPSDIILRWRLTERTIIQDRVNATELKLKGNTVLSDRKLDELVGKIPTQEASNYDVLQAVAPVYDYYISEGFNFVDFSFETLDEDLLVLQLFEGEIIDLVIEGNENTREKVITNRLFLSEGEIYNQDLMVSSRRRLLDLGYFSEVEPRPERTSEGVKLAVKVTEKERLNNIDGGLTWSQDRGFGGRLRLTTKNLFGFGQDLSFTLSRDFAPDAQFDGSLDWKNVYYPPGFNFTEISLYRNVGSSEGVRASFGYPLSADLSLNLGYNADWMWDERVPTHIISADLIYDVRDNPVFPTSGNRSSFKVEKAGDFAPGESFTQVTVQNAYFQELPDLKIVGERKQTFGLNLELGLGQQTPPSYQSQFGGKDSIRGMEGRNSSNYGFLNSEYRLQLVPGGLYVAPFIDTGIDFDEDSEIEVSTGFEINIQLFGHVRIGFAWPLSDEVGYVPEIYFGMGPMF